MYIIAKVVETFGRLGGIASAWGALIFLAVALAISAYFKYWFQAKRRQMELEKEKQDAMLNEVTSYRTMMFNHLKHQSDDFKEFMKNSMKWQVESLVVLKDVKDSQTADMKLLQDQHQAMLTKLSILEDRDG